MSKKKLLTEELIEKRLEKQGLLLGLPQAERLQKLEELHDFEITNKWESGCDAFFYVETTADDYEVFIACEDDRNTIVNEDVYYYKESWFEKLADYLRSGAIVYIDEYEQDGYGFEEVIEAMYEDLYMDEYKEIEAELLEEGYEYDVEDE
tara:strand:- start:10 stop:459 length:450 start_codon:yes stop_codon:yes gene_type:complete